MFLRRMAGPLSARVKEMTRIVGLPVVPSAREVLIGLYRKTLEAVQPVQYRKTVEEEDWRKIEKRVGNRQVEQLIQQAKLRIPRMAACHCEQRRGMSSGAKDREDKETISVTFVDKDGEETPISVPIGMSMLEAAHENDIELEGACEGSLACSTCHVIVMEEDMYSKLPEPTDEENDMLDLAFGLTETSRLGCQVIAEKKLDGLRLALPAATRNFAVDGHVPKPH